MLSAIAIAMPDSQQLGPYTVSFDINTNYKAQIAPPIEVENANAYEIGLFVDNSTFAVIDITEFAELTDTNLQVSKTLMPLNMIIKEGLNANNVEDKAIDGKEGFLVTSVPFKMDNATSGVVYRAMYWLDSEKCECGPVSVGTTNVVVTSTLSQDVTDSLLSSLHIVKGEIAAQSPALDNKEQSPA